MTSLSVQARMRQLYAYAENKPTLYLLLEALMCFPTTDYIETVAMAKDLYTQLH